MIRITFLGTSHGVPEHDRFCSSTLIEIGENRYLIDMGGPVIDSLIRRNIPLDSIRGIFITHPHGDHMDGLVSFVDLLTWYFQTPTPEIWLPTDGIVEALNSWLKVTQLDGVAPRLSFNILKEGLIFDDGTLRVTAIPTQHCPHSHAFLLEAEGKSIVFTGDLRHPTIDFPQVCFQRTCDLIVCEAAHFPTTEAAPIFEKAAPKRVLINHICPWRHLPSIETVRQSERSYEFDCVWDGYELTL